MRNEDTTSYHQLCELHSEQNERLANLLEELMNRHKLALDALHAAKAFIDCHVGDPDITDEMSKRYEEYNNAISEWRTARQIAAKAVEG